LLNTNPVPLAGVLSIGFFIHPFVIPIVRKTSAPAKQERDIVLGYFLVFFTYFMVGTAGFYGFLGNYFSEYSKTADVNNWPIAQNCITMFNSNNILALIVQIVMLVLCTSTYPLINIFII